MDTVTESGGNMAGDIRGRRTKMLLPSLCIHKGRGTPCLCDFSLSYFFYLGSLFWRVVPFSADGVLSLEAYWISAFPSCSGHHGSFS